MKRNVEHNLKPLEIQPLPKREQNTTPPFVFSKEATENARSLANSIDDFMEAHCTQMTEEEYEHLRQAVEDLFEINRRGLFSFSPENVGNRLDVKEA